MYFRSAQLQVQTERQQSYCTFLMVESFYSRSNTVYFYLLLTLQRQSQQILYDPNAVSATVHIQKLVVRN
jgi:hypothetical protein